ncbi:transporter substrate-binding domain-containing protein [Gillisia sp. M10.2A]|uniref:Transporter substrate-binding domain-containing protein n=1 Tax=Gillisia lutea TaxID=2909668 RepID=A0ABS9EHD1_9FLAO|nr:transporter substrate-binding domain-containing protein [Gillisia lutea]MCF4101722.1 transporter substrate-binding domain-containing protein [Gillisia lutea]
MSRRKLVYFILFNFLLTSLVSCKIPKDPQNSWNKAKENELIVGVVANPPFTAVTNENFTGSEIELIRNFARENHLKVNFIEDNESNLIKKLQDYKVSVVIGGFDKKSVWKDKAGLSKTYDDKHVLLLPKGENELLIHLESYIYKINK